MGCLHVFQPLHLKSSASSYLLSESFRIRIKVYADYTDVFSEEGAASLPDHTRVEHAIPIQEGQETSRNKGRWWSKLFLSESAYGG
jgi:hypothetical protein